MLNRLSLRVNLAVSIITMGFLGVVLAIFVAETYRDYAIDSQRAAFEQIVDLQVHHLFNELARVSHDLGQALQSEQDFPKIFRERDTEALEQHLQSQFHQYFVTAGVIKLESLAVYDDKFALVARAFSGTAPLDASCPSLHVRAASRKGPLRLKTITELCLANGKPHFSMLLPIGGLHIAGYLEIVTNPMYTSQEVGKSLGLPLRLHFIDGLKAYESRDWPASSVEQKGVVATYQPLTETGEPAFTLSVARDVSKFESQLTATRNIYVALVSFIALLLAFLMIYLLNKTALQPLQRLGNQLRNIRRDKKQLGTPVTVSGNTEVRELASGFNEMTNELKGLYDTLLTRNEDLSQEINIREAAEREIKKHRDHLEDLVEQRTLDLAKARDAALEASRSKSLFLSNMSHELRTPLNAIIGYSEIIAEDLETSGDIHNARDLKEVHSAGQHLLAMVNDILDLTKIEAGKMDLYEEWFDVNSMVKSITDTVQPVLAQNHNHLEVECPENLGSLFADITKIRQTLFNLLSNAGKFTSDGKIQFSIWQEAVGDQKYICFRVKDEGIGISQEQQEKLFEAFSRVDVSATRKFGGTGLGLVISQHFCHMMGGTIEMQSEFGKGATFTVKLPIKKPHVSEVTDKKPDETVGSWQSGATAADKRFSVMREESNTERREHVSTVLVIDNDPAARQIMMHHLTLRGFEVQTAASGEEGLKSAALIKPDVITLEIMMPGMDGWGVLESLKQNPELCNIPVIMVTMIESRSIGYSLGAIEHLPKPIDKQRLYDIVSHCVRQNNNGSVLVVDNDGDMRETIQNAFESKNWTVETAAGAEAALASINTNPPALIMLDLVMTEMDGFDFLDQLRHNPRWKDIPVVVITGKNLTAEERRRLDGQVAKIINKSGFARKDLLDEILHTVTTSLSEHNKKQTALT